MKTVLVSACLLGIPCRYDGNKKTCPAVSQLAKSYRLIPVCPEVLGGLPTPRPPAEFDGDKVKRQDGTDVTIPFQKGAQEALAIYRENHCSFAVLKEKSPSCGKQCYDGTFTRQLENKAGVTAALLMQNNISVYSEEELDRIP